MNAPPPPSKTSLFTVLPSNFLGKSARCGQGTTFPHLVPHLEPAPHLLVQPGPYWLVWLDKESPWTETLTPMGAETWVESSSHSRRNDFIRHLEAKEVTWKAGVRSSNLSENFKWPPVWLGCPWSFLAWEPPGPTPPCCYLVPVWPRTELMGNQQSGHRHRTVSSSASEKGTPSRRLTSWAGSGCGPAF